MITAENYTSLKGKYFKYLTGTYLCKNIESKKYGNYLVLTDSRSLLINAAGFVDIVVLECDDEEAQTAARLRQIKERNKNKAMSNGYVSKIRSKSRRKKVESEEREPIDKVFETIYPKREMKRIPEPKPVVKKKMKQKDLEKSIKHLKTGKFQQWEDDLISDEKNSMEFLFEKTHRKIQALHSRRWYLKTRPKPKTEKEKKPREAKPTKEAKIRTNGFTPEQDALIMNTGSERGAMKRLAERLGVAKTKVISRKVYLNKKKNEGTMEILDYKVGNTVKDQYGDEGVIVEIDNFLFKSLYVVQIVNVKSPHKVYRGMKRRYGKGTLEKIDKISPK